MIHDLASSAAANVTWLAAQSTGTWNPSPQRREMVGIICDTSRWLHLTTARVLHDLEPPVPDPYWLQAAEQSLVWCNTISRGGLRAKVAWVTIGQLGGDREEYLSAWQTVAQHAAELRDIIGRSTAMLDPHERDVVEANLGLARWAARRWAGNVPDSDAGYSLDDAYHDAVLGLTKAVKGYDPARGTLANYAYPFMQKSIMLGEARARDRKAPPRGGEITESCAGYTDEHLAEAEWSTFAPEIMDVVRRVCTDDIDRALVEAMIAAPPGEPRAATLRLLAPEVGESLTSLTSRWYELRDMLAERLVHLRAS